MKIGELAACSGLSVHTLRYYERIGLLPRALRDGAGQRDYDPSILVWIAFLGRLKTTGMPIREMLRYAALREQGDTTRAARQSLLEAHRKQVQDKIAELTACLAVLDTKIAGYGEATPKVESDDDRDDRKPV